MRGKTESQTRGILSTATIGKGMKDARVREREKKVLPTAWKAVGEAFKKLIKSEATE